MPLLTAETIRTWLGKAEIQLEPLHTRMSDDLALWRMEEIFPADSPQPKDKHRTMARNDLRALAEKVIGTLLSAQPNIRLPIVYGQDQKAEAFSDIERMAYIALDEVNEKLRQRLQGNLATIAANDFSLRGWGCGVFLVLDKGKDGIGFDMRRWEPIETYFSVDAEGIYRAAHRRWEPEGQLALQYPELDLDEEKDTLVEVIDFWEVERGKGKQGLYNAIIVKTEFAKEPTKQKFTKMPVCIIPVPGPVPATDQSGERLNVEDWGESIFGANRTIAKLWNELDTEMLNHVISEIHKGILLSGPGAQEMAESIEKFGEDDIAHHTPDDFKAQTTPRPIPVEGQILRQGFEQQMQRGGLSYVSWGQIPGQLSALAISNLAAQEESFVTPRAQAMAEMIRFGIESWLHQLSSMNKTFEGLFRQGKTLLPVKVERLEEIPRVEVTIEPRLPGKELQAVAAALQMRQLGPGGRPLISDLTILEEYLRVDDPVEEERRKDVQEAESMPFVRLQKMADSARRKELTELADILEKMADRQLEKAMGELEPKPQGNLPPGANPTLPPPEAMSPGAIPTLPDVNEPSNGQPSIEDIRRMITA